MYLINVFCCANKHPRTKKKKLYCTKHLCCSLFLSADFFFSLSLSLSFPSPSWDNNQSPPHSARKKEKKKKKRKRTLKIIIKKKAKKTPSHRKCENENFVVVDGGGDGMEPGEIFLLKLLQTRS